MKKQSISSRVFSSRAKEQGEVSLPAVVKKGEKTVKSVNEQGQSILIVRAQNGEISINLSEIRKNLELLKIQTNSFLKDLSPSDRQTHDHIVTVINHLAGTGTISHIEDIIREVFKGVSITMPGTVGAYYIGCSQHTNFTGTPGCSAACAGSLSPEQGTMGWQACQHICFLYNGKQSFSFLNEVPDHNNAYIFIKDSIPFSGFSEDEISKLKAHGVNKVKVVTYKNSAEYTDVTKEFTPLESLQSKEEEKTRSLIPAGKKEASGKPGASRGTESSGSMLLLLLIILLLLGGIYYFTRKNK